MTTGQYNRIYQLIFVAKDYKTAEIWLRDCLSYNPNENDAVFLLSWALTLQGLYVESYALANALVRNSINSTRKAQYYYLLTEICFYQSQWTTTLYYSEFAQKLYKSYSPQSYDAIVKSISRAAYSYFMLGDFSNSDRQYERAIKLSDEKNLTDHFIYSEYAELKYKMRHYDTALNNYKKSMKLLEKDKFIDLELKNQLLSQSKNVLGCICLEKGQVKLAYDYFYDSVSLNPENHSAILNLAEVYAIRNSIGKAKYYLGKGLNAIDLKYSKYWISSLIEGKSYSFYKINTLYRIILGFFWERGLIDKEVYDVHFKSTHANIHISNSKIKIFISYSHQDETYKDKIHNHLAPLWQNEKIETWNDRMLLPGSPWDEGIKYELKTAHIVLFLISSDFNSSKYIWENEITETIKRSENGEVIAIPIFTRPCDFQDMPYARLQGLPKDAKPISTYFNQDEAYLEIAKSIREIVDRLISDKK